ncbi:unnamed protein product [Ilex paraguariensis]|uniref:NTF2 domain-containing protein n=1 Tax=Ilex paraguariensis TaxID=185542 RepID=A0ABC8SYA9_9AQUA
MASPYRASVSAVQVGRYFVQQYYPVLCQRPHLVHHFYTDDSSMVRVDGNSSKTVSAKLAAYSAFGSYGSSYVHPQTPSSVAQTAAYGAYPSTYVAQQSYAPSSTAATLTTAQQPTSAPPQAYYGSNY